MKDILDAGECRDSVDQTYHLSTGALTLSLKDEGNADLFRLAERQNPKRAFLFVSTVLGRHIPVDPKEHRKSLLNLAKKVSSELNSGPVLVMGYAETAVGIGAGVFDCLRNMKTDLQIGYLHTTRHPVPDQDVWFTIQEGHSHATEHSVMRPGPSLCRSGENATLVLVDDETTTGSTFAQLAGKLAENGMHFGRILLVTLTDWSDGNAVERVCEASGCDDVRAISLLDGTWTWKPDQDAILPSLPDSITAECPEWRPSTSQEMRSPREGIKGKEMSNGLYLAWKLKLPNLRKTDRLLVIGSGEHVWQPFLYAEACADDGIDVGFIATTRSPILPGPVIEHKITFPDHFGLGLEMYLHNVNPGDWDRIVLFTETGIDGVHPELRKSLGKGFVVDKDGCVYSMIERKE